MKFVVRIVAIDRCNGQKVIVHSDLNWVVGTCPRDNIRVERGGIQYSREKADLCDFDFEIEKGDA